MSPVSWLACHNWLLCTCAAFPLWDFQWLLLNKKKRSAYVSWDFEYLHSIAHPADLNTYLHHQHFVTTFNCKSLSFFHCRFNVYTSFFFKVTSSSLLVSLWVHFEKEKKVNQRSVSAATPFLKCPLCWEDSRALLTRVELLCSLANANSTAYLHSSTSGSLLLTKLLLSYVTTNSFGGQPLCWCQS